MFIRVGILIVLCSGLHCCCGGKRVLSRRYTGKLNTQPFGLVLSPGCGKLARSYKERDDEINDKESQTKISPVSI